MAVDQLKSGDYWHLWNMAYGMTDSGDAGFIKWVDDGFEAVSRGDIPQSQGVFPTLEGAEACLRSIY